MISGLQPETFASFIGQRSRWCQGMMQILMLKNPALKKGLHFIQRVCYLSSMTFWFFPIPRLLFMFAPPSDVVAATTNAPTTSVTHVVIQPLDADAFAAFKETGDIFDPQTAKKLHDHVYSAGGKADPEALYTAFRGRLPTPDALLRKRGFAPETTSA